MPNPYQPPASLDEPPIPPGGGRIIRIKHLRRESNIRFFANLCIATAIVFFPDGVLRVIRHEPGIPNILLSLGIGVAALAIGIGLRSLRLWARVAAVSLACVSVASFPFGTIPGIFLLTLLLDRKANVVFSAGYKEAIAATPDMKHKHSAPAVFLLIALLAIVAAAFWMSLDSSATGR